LSCKGLSLVRFELCGFRTAIHGLELVRVLVVVIASASATLVLGFCRLILLIVKARCSMGLLLITSNSRAIQTPSLQTHIGKWFLLAQGLLVKQVVGCSYVIVPVSFDALH